MFKPIKRLWGNDLSVCVCVVGGLGSEEGRLKGGIWERGFQGQIHLTAQGTLPCSRMAEAVVVLTMQMGFTESYRAKTNQEG